MKSLLFTDPNLVHKETDFNLLGWVNKKEGKLKDAIACLKTSILVNNLHNAANIHMTDIQDTINTIKMAVKLYMQGIRM